MGSLTPLPYWQINVPPPLREELCPPFLQNLKPKDLSIISTPDSAYHILTWSEVQSIIRANAIDAFQRIPSELRRYFEYNYFLKQKYGSVMDFVLSERLKWTGVPVLAQGKTPFECPSDVKILWNDWPYGIDARIVHLVVWCKFELEDDEETGDLTVEARALVDRYVDETFVSKVGRENVSLLRLFPP